MRSSELLPINNGHDSMPINYTHEGEYLDDDTIVAIRRSPQVRQIINTALREQSLRLLRHSKLLRFVSSEQRSNTRILKVCQCCGMEYNATLWYKAEYIGWQTGLRSAGELRNCKCGSTIYLVVERKERKPK